MKQISAPDRKSGDDLKPTASVTAVGKRPGTCYHPGDRLLRSAAIKRQQAATEKGFRLQRHLSIRLLDDAAAQRAARDEPSLTRTRLLQRAVVGGGAIVAGGVLLGGLPEVAPGARSKAQDVKILNLVCSSRSWRRPSTRTRKQRGALEASWRSSRASWASTSGHTSPSSARRSATAGGTEADLRLRQHDRNSDRFVATAAMLEDTAVAAYNGQAGESDEADLEGGSDDRLGRGSSRRLDPRHRRPAGFSAGNRYPGHRAAGSARRSHARAS